MFPKIPTNLGELSIEELNALTAEIIAALAVAARTAELSDEDANASQDAALALEAITDEIGRRSALSALETSLTEKITASVISALEALKPATLEEEAPAEEADAEETDEDEEAEEEADEEPAPTAEQLAANSDLGDEGQPAAETVTLASDAGKLKAGTVMTDELAVAEAFHQVARTMQDHQTRTVVTLTHEGLPRLTGDAIVDTEIIRSLLSQGGDAAALVASGGWGTPSQVNYGFFELEGAPQVLDLPTVQVDRGGLRYVSGGGPTLADILGSTALWTWDETTDITPGATVKTRLKIDNSWTFDDVRLAAYGVALDNGNLVARSWPELTRRFMRLAMLAHIHDVNAKFIAAIAAGSTAKDRKTIYVSPDATVKDGFTATILDHAAFEAEVMREKFYTDDELTLDVVLPLWVEDVVRADLSRRNGVDKLAVSDSEINGLFTARNLRPQFVHSYQKLGDAASRWPATMKFLIYPTGTWVKGTGGSLDLGVTRDSVLNATNDYTAMWSEEFLSLMKFGPDSREVEINVKASGASGGLTTLP